MPADLCSSDATTTLNTSVEVSGSDIHQALSVLIEVDGSRRILTDNHAPLLASDVSIVERHRVHTVSVKLVGVGAVVLVMLTCACSPVEVDEPRLPIALVRPTQFAPPPPPITDELPTAEQLTTLFAASLNYSIREEDRARLFDGPSEGNLSLARAWGAQPDPQHVEFTTVEPTGPDSVDAYGPGHLGDIEPYPVGPIPFVRYDNEWKVSRSLACGMVKMFDGDDICG